MGYLIEALGIAWILTGLLGAILLVVALALGKRRCKRDEDFPSGP
jgi:hypothetical protein